MGHLVDRRDTGHEKNLPESFPGGLRTEGATRRYVRKPPRRIIIETAVDTASSCMPAMLADIADPGAEAWGCPARGDAAKRLAPVCTSVLFAGSGSLVAISPIGRRSGADLNAPASHAADDVSLHGFSGAGDAAQQ